MPNSLLLSAFITSLSTKLPFKISIPLLSLTFPPFLLLFLALFFLLNCSLRPPPPYLVHKVFEGCFLNSVPLSGRLWGLGSLYPLVVEAQGGDTSTTNTKQYPDMRPPFCFLQWEASSTKDIQRFRGLHGSFDRAGAKLTVIPVKHNCEHLQCWNK